MQLDGFLLFSCSFHAQSMSGFRIAHLVVFMHFERHGKSGNTPVQAMPGR